MIDHFVLFLIKAGYLDNVFWVTVLVPQNAIIINNNNVFTDLYVLVSAPRSLARLPKVRDCYGPVIKNDD